MVFKSVNVVLVVGLLTSNFVYNVTESQFILKISTRTFVQYVTFGSSLRVPTKRVLIVRTDQQHQQILFEVFDLTL